MPDRSPPSKRVRLGKLVQDLEDSDSPRSALAPQGMADLDIRAELEAFKAKVSFDGVIPAEIWPVSVFAVCCSSRVLASEAREP